MRPMYEIKIQKLLTDILFAELGETEAAPETLLSITPETLIAVCRLAKKHDLAHIVSSFVYRNRIEVEPELLSKLEREEALSVYRYEQMKYSFSEICAILEEASIDYVPLKGAVIRPYYPKERMRTSCDIDILIHEEDLSLALESLEKKGYRVDKRGYHDISLYSPNKIHLELHFNILENRESLDSVLKDAWQYAEKKDGHRYEFSREFFVFQMYAHMAYHFLAGGCGMRSLMDIWVMENRMNAHFSDAEELLKKAGIYTFASEMSRISNMCFTENTEDELAELVLKYIYNGGVYGSYENTIAVFKTKNNSSFGYLMKRLFMPYKTMKELFPILKKAPILLPVFWVVRWVRAIFEGRTKSFVGEISSSKSVTDTSVGEAREICSRLGLDT